MRKEEGSHRPYLWLGIWDKKVNNIKFKVRRLSFDDIPRELQYSGYIIEALEWDDNNGRNILLLSKTNAFTITNIFSRKHKDYDDGDIKIEVNAYLYIDKKNKNQFKRMWKVFDFETCPNWADFEVGFYYNSLTISDIDNDRFAEITMLYYKTCTTDISPQPKKLIMYKNKDKYAIR